MSKIVKGLGFVVVALVVLWITVPVSDGLQCRTPTGVECDCNCGSFDQECVYCKTIFEGYECMVSFYGGYCDCETFPGVLPSCSNSGECCVWV